MGDMQPEPNPARLLIHDALLTKVYSLALKKYVIINVLFLECVYKFSLGILYKIQNVMKYIDEAHEE